LRFSQWGLQRVFIVLWVVTPCSSGEPDVSGEYIICIFRVKESNKEETSKQKLLQLAS
jgi:hypothetical protein